jgi:hypothetical protein
LDPRIEKRWWTLSTQKISLIGIFAIEIGKFPNSCEGAAIGISINRAIGYNKRPMSVRPG